MTTQYCLVWTPQTNANVVALIPDKKGASQIIHSNCTVTFAHRDYLTQQKNVHKATNEQKGLAEELLSLSHESLPVLQKVTITGNRIVLYKMDGTWRKVAKKIEEAIKKFIPSATLENIPIAGAVL